MQTWVVVAQRVACGGHTLAEAMPTTLLAWRAGLPATAKRHPKTMTTV